MNFIGNARNNFIDEIHISVSSLLKSKLACFIQFVKRLLEINFEIHPSALVEGTTKPSFDVIGIYSSFINYIISFNKCLKLGVWSLGDVSIIEKIFDLVKHNLNGKGYVNN